MRIVRFSEQPDLPWKNGGGTTRELISASSGSTGFHWRVSIATIDRDGRFSTFPGVDRTLLVLDGHGHLTISGHPVDLEPGAIVRFDGGDPVSATVRDGPIRALNVMSTTQDWRHEVHFRQAIRMSSSPDEQPRMFVVLEGRADFDLQQGDVVLGIRDDECLDDIAAAEISFDRRARHTI